MISVLYVDDDDNFCRLSEIYLKKMGDFSVTTVGSAKKALDLVLSGRYDIVVSDYQMPLMNGIDLLKEYRNKGDYTPFILFTGKGREEVVIEAINNGAAFYLQKGRDTKSLFAELAHKIRQAVSHKNAERLLKESEEKFRSLFETSRDGIILIVDGKIIECNPYAAFLFRVKKEVLTNSLFYNWTPDFQSDGTNSRNKADEIFLSALKEGGINTKWLFMRKDKTLFHSEISISALEIGGRVILQAVIRDITERLKNEEELNKRNLDLSAAYEELQASGEELEKGLDELRQSQEDLLESKERYQNLADLLPCGVFESTTDGTLIYVNREAFLMFGFDPDTDISEFSIPMFVHPDELSRVFKILASPGDMVKDHQYRARRKDGSFFPAIIRSSQIIKNGKFVGLRGVVIDISEQKRAESAIIESERRLTDVIEFLPDATLVISKDGRILSWNRAISDLTGKKADDMLGKDNFEYSLPFYGTRRPILADIVINPDYAGECNYSFMSHEGDVIIAEVYVPLIKDGPKYLWVKSAPLRNSDGEIIGAIESIRDITKWKEAQDLLTRNQDELEQKIEARTRELVQLNKALAESEERHRILIELSPDTILVHDGELIKFINPAGIRLLGASRIDEIIGHRYLEFIHPDSQKAVLSRITDILQKDKNLESMEELFIGISGNSIQVEVSTMLITYGGIKSILIVARDISVRKESEYILKEYASALEDKNRELDFLTNKLVSLNHDLDERVRKRTEEVTKLLNLKDDFITRLGHDIKTPLTPLIALMPILLEEESDPEKRDTISVLLRSVYSIRDQTEKILALTRLSKQEMISDINSLKPANLVNQAIDRNWLFIRSKKLTIINEISNDLILNFSERDLSSAIDNLISNAIKFTKMGGKIRIYSSTNNGRICISVEDTGIGLSEEEAEHVFDEFYMADSSRHDRQSSGLGLTIVKRIMDLYGGDVIVESRGKDLGSIFTLCFPGKLSGSD